MDQSEVRGQDQDQRWVSKKDSKCNDKGQDYQASDCMDYKVKVPNKISNEFIWGKTSKYNFGKCFVKNMLI